MPVLEVVPDAAEVASAEVVADAAPDGEKVSTPAASSVAAAASGESGESAGGESAGGESAARAASFDGVPEEARGVIELFSGQLASISFPDVDAAVLEQHAAAVQAERRAVEAARAALEVATVELARKSEELTVLARRGLAYARIYAAAHPEKQELAAGLTRLESRERSPKLREDGSPAPRRGRPPKAPRFELPFAATGVSSNGGDARRAAEPEAGERAARAAANEREEEEMGEAGEQGGDISEEDSVESEPVLERDE